MSRRPLLEGGCQCGTVRYALFSQPRGSLCHCRMCQRATGAPFAALTALPKEDFAWTRGEPAFFNSSTVAKRGFCRDCGTPVSFTYANGPNTNVTVAKRGFCRDCGTPVSFTYANGPNTNVTVGSLDDPERANVTTHYGVESRLGWLKMCDGLPGHQTGGDAAAASRMAGMISRQA